MPDWEAIEKDFKAGQSLRVLASKYDVSKSAIHKHCNKVDKDLVDGGQTVDIGSLSTVAIDPAALAKKLIEQLDTIANVPLDLKEHQLFAQALSQYNKILLTAPVNQELPKGIDWSIFEQAELDIIQPIFARAEERRRMELGETTIPQLRKHV